LVDISAPEESSVSRPTRNLKNGRENSSKNTDQTDFAKLCAALNAASYIVEVEWPLFNKAFSARPKTSISSLNAREIARAGYERLWRFYRTNP
jgi:hypothetical protein